MTRLDAIDCPRCGHDLRGIVESWIESCPVTGVCAECGVDFEWRHVAGSDRMPRWFVECECRRWFSGTRTLVRSLMPWRFWRSIRMTMPVRAALWTYPLRLAVILVLLGALATGIRAFLSTGASMRRDPQAVAVVVFAATFAPFLETPVDALMDCMSPGWSQRVSPSPIPWVSQWM